MAKIIFSFKKSFLEKEGLTKEGMERCLSILAKEFRKAFAPGTIRVWKGKKYIKGADKKWRPYSEKKGNLGKKVVPSSKKTELKAEWKSDIFSESEQQAMKDLDKVFKAGKVTIKNEQYNKTFTVKLGRPYKSDKTGEGSIGLFNMLNKVFYKKRPPYDVYRAGAFLQMVFEKIHRDPYSKEGFELFTINDYDNKNNFIVFGAYLDFRNQDDRDLHEKTERLRISKDPGTLLFLENVQKVLESEENAAMIKEQEETKKYLERHKEECIDIGNEKETDEKAENNNYKIKRDFESELSKSLVGEGVKESSTEIMNEIYDLFDNCGNDTAKKVFEKYLKDIHIKDTNGRNTFFPNEYFDTEKRNTLSINLYDIVHPEANAIHKKYEALLHESFHAMDNNVQSDLGSISQRVYQKVKQKDGTEKIMFFADVLRQDAQEYIKQSKPRIKKEFYDIAKKNEDRDELIKSLKEAGFFKNDESEQDFYKRNPNVEIKPTERLIRNKMSKEIYLENENNKNHFAFSDMIQSATADDYCGFVSGSTGHIKDKDLDKRESGDYWNDKSIAREATANMFAALITNKDEFEYFKEVFPNGVKFFGKMLKSMLNY